MSGLDPRQRLFSLLERGVSDAVFPGCVAIVWRAGAVVYHEAHGALATHEAVSVRHEPVRRDSVFDLASLTKVLCTTTLVAIGTSEGSLDLDATVPEPWSAACPGATLLDVLEHCSGAVAHREYFTEVAPFDRDAVLARVAATPPESPPRRRAVYSDVGFMILGAWIEQAMGGRLDRLFADRVVYPLGLDQKPVPKLGYRRLTGAIEPPTGLERRIVPTEVYDPELHAAGVPSHFAVRGHRPYAHGEVHDDNAYVMGGVAGHAGLFGTAWGVLEVARAWLEGGIPGLEPTIRDLFWTPSTVSGSTRHKGFDGVEPDGGGSTGGSLSAAAVGHTGYTGTSLWIDPAPGHESRIILLLSNRVHPSRTNEAIKAFRPEFHAAAVKL